MPNKSHKSWKERDAQVLWHPFTQHLVDPESIGIVRAKGALLFDEDGKTYIDAIASWWVNLHGHGHAYLAKKISEQARSLEHVIFAGFTHPPAVRLAERLLTKMPSHFEKVFLSDNGSTAVEVAIKMALQYFHNLGQTKRRKILALEGAYHGDTFGAMSLGSPSSFNAPFQDMLFEVEFLPSPQDPTACIAAMEACLQNADAYAAFIFEPLVQGASGMQFYAAQTLDTLQALAKAKGLLCIADEIMTGFGRLGTWFAMDQLQIKPDLLCLSKGLTGGMMAMGATICSQAMYEAYLSEDRRKTFFHSHSFSGNPLACAAANASLDLLEQPLVWERIAKLERAHLAWAKSMQNHPRLRNLRVKGSLLAFEIASNEKNDYLDPIRDQVYQFCLEQGVLIRPLGNTIYLLPPYVITRKELKKIYDCLEQFLEKLVLN